MSISTRKYIPKEVYIRLSQQGLTRKEIMEKLEISRFTMSHAVKRLNLDLPKRSRKSYQS